jgi:hypothetical protein
MIAILRNLLKLDNFIINLLTTCISPFISFETCFVTCWMILILNNLTLRSEILCQMFSSWWDIEEVCASCAKSARSCCLVLKLLKFSLFLVLNKKFQYSDLEAPRCLPYQVEWPSTWSRDHLRKIMSNRVILKLWGVYYTQLYDPQQGLEIIWGFKMSKLLYLISYSLACLLTCTNWVLSCICEHLAKHASWIIVAHLEMISILFIYACLAWDQSPYACVDFAQIATSLSFISSSLLHVFLSINSLVVRINSHFCQILAPCWA